ncbi:MAG: Asp-tRNA(Asn)/Glu-tRNA(Gln) amidotransferase subunit GatC [bacterium]|nr:Asp-tRNA(Asn)/Glu-tRNA(Gln) amidotransferase subunit GatC [bacterium]
MISKEEVKHIAKLARLGLTEDEIGKFQKDLSSILDYIEKLKEVDVSGVEPMSHSVLETAGEQGGRKDEVKSADSETRNGIIGQAPEAKDGYLKVKSIFNEAN